MEIKAVKVLVPFAVCEPSLYVPSVRIEGKELGEAIEIKCSGAIPNEDFEIHNPMIMDWVKSDNGDYYISHLPTEFTEQQVASFQILCLPNDGENRKATFTIADSKSFDIELVRGQGYNDITISDIDLGNTTNNEKVIKTIAVTNNCEYPINITGIKLNTNKINVEIDKYGLIIEPNEVKAFEVVFQITGAFVPDNLYAKVYYTIDSNDECYTTAKVNGNYTHTLDGEVVSVKITSFVNIDGEKTRVKELIGLNESVSLGTGLTGIANKEVTVPIRFDNVSDKNILVNGFLYNSSGSFMVKGSMPKESVQVLIGEAKTINLTIKVQEVTGFHTGILLFNMVQEGANPNGSFTETAKITFTWGKNS